jgi:BirA family biotin operon repressor/biotin-[acetyl-CoA-carboxylase] ligase
MGVGGEVTDAEGPGGTTRWLGRPLVRLATVDSTNREARRWADGGAAHGLVVVADEQTAGRGRLERTWHSPPREGVYASALLRPGPDPTRLGLVGVAAAIATAEAVEDAGVRSARIKWPNDVWVEGRKIAGVLVEARDAGRAEGIVVIGIGVNVGQTAFPDGLRVPATSVRLETGEALSPEAVLGRLLARLEPWLDALLAGRVSALDAAFSARDALAGRRISFTLDRREVEGEVLAISPLEGLRLRLASGEERTFPPDHVNEVTAIDAGERAR